MELDEHINTHTHMHLKILFGKIAECAASNNFSFKNNKRNEKKSVPPTECLAVVLPVD